MYDDAWYDAGWYDDDVMDDPDGYYRQSATACCPRQTIPDSCSCPDGCACLCADCGCRLPEDDDGD